MRNHKVEHYVKNLTKNKLYWLLQLYGWSFYCVTYLIDNYFLYYGGPKSLLDLTLPLILFALAGFGLSLILRFIYQKVERHGLAVFWFTALISCTAFAFIWTIFKRLCLWYFLHPDKLEQWLNGDQNLLIVLFNYSSSLLLFFCWSAFYYGINYHFKFLKQTQKTLAIETDYQRSKLELLRYQLNPHFLFNSLNAASNLALRGDGEQTSDLLAKLSRFLRFSLDNSSNEKSTLQHDLAVMKEYLEIEGIRFGQRLRVDWCLAPNTLNVLVPSFLIQPLIENVIKHALVTSKETTVLTIQSAVRGNYLLLTIKDNGPLQALEPLNAGQGIGINNIRDRLELFYDKNYELNMKINESHGLIVEIKLPID